MNNLDRLKVTIITVVDVNTNDVILFQTARRTPYDALAEVADWYNQSSDDANETASTIERTLEDGDYVYLMSDMYL